jgi:hypothetical protein
MAFLSPGGSTASKNVKKSQFVISIGNRNNTKLQNAE